MGHKFNDCYLESFLKVCVCVSTEEDDKQDADGDTLNSQPHRDVAVLAAGHAEHSKHGHDDPEHEAAQQEEEHGAVDCGEGVLFQGELLLDRALSLVRLPGQGQWGSWDSCQILS